MKHAGNESSAAQGGQQTQAVQGRAAASGGANTAALKGMNYAEGARAVAPPPGGHGRLVPSVAAQGVQGGGGALPYQEQIQRSFGQHDLSGVKAHVGGAGGAAAKQMGASAYAYGQHAAFDGAPDLHTAAHEATHLVMQARGVAPGGGVGREDDAYERHADEVADLVVRGESAEAKLNELAPAGGQGGGQAQGAAGVQAKAVQFDKIGGKPIASLTPATVDQMVKALSQTAGWKEIVALWAMVTDGGTSELTSADRDDLVLEVLILVESAFTFQGDASVDALWGDAALLGRFMGAVERAGTPKKDGPTDDPTPAPEVVLPNPGTFGVLTADAELVGEGGATFTVREGEGVETRYGQDGKLVVEVLGRPKGKTGAVDPALFKAQPRLSENDDGEMDDYSYKKYEGELFLARGDVAAASVMDIDQGALGDCYLISAMGAVAASNPDVIADMIDYDASTGTFTVTFQELQRGGTFKPHTEEVDAYFPTRRGGSRMAYALSDTSFNPANQALWPAVIEKAYAQWQGGYEEIGGGGSSAGAMEALTGVRSARQAMPRERDVIARFEQFTAENKAVVCGTRDWIDQRRVEGLWSGEGSGPYTGTLTDKEGNDAEIVKDSVSIRDREGNSGQLRDDGDGGLTGNGLKDGSVAYDSGKTRFSYDEGKGPADPADLVTTYQFEGTLSASLNIHGNHAYVFREVKDGKLQFHNPWGPAAHKHPKPVSAREFLDLFETLGVNATVPQQER